MEKATNPATSREGYSDEEFAWLKAVQAYQKRVRRKFLTHADYLQIARGMGYPIPAAETPAAVTSLSSTSEG